VLETGPDGEIRQNCHFCQYRDLQSHADCADVKSNNYQSYFTAVLLLRAIEKQSLRDVDCQKFLRVSMRQPSEFMRCVKQTPVHVDLRKTVSKLSTNSAAVAARIDNYFMMTVSIPAMASKAVKPQYDICPTGGGTVKFDRHERRD
jgi:hypothetical protein